MCTLPRRIEPKDRDLPVANFRRDRVLAAIGLRREGANILDQRVSVWNATGDWLRLLSSLPETKTPAPMLELRRSVAAAVGAMQSRQNPYLLSFAGVLFSLSELSSLAWYSSMRGRDE